MTRTSAARNTSASNPGLSGRVTRHNRSRSFKKSAKDRAPLGGLSLNHRDGGSKRPTKSNPFASFNPNKSGIILPVDDASPEPSDFSRFLSTSPANSPSKGGGRSTSNGSSENANGSGNGAQRVSPESRSSHNAQRKRASSNSSKDDLIFAGLQRFNSMTVPFDARPANTHKASRHQMAPLNHSANGSHSKRSAARRPEATESRTHHLDYLPMDWTLKRTLYFVSDQSLDWCCNIPLKIRNAAMLRVDPHSLDISSEGERKQYEFYKEMIHYRYPHEKWSPSQLTQLHQFYLSHCGELEPLQKAKSKNQGQFGADKSTTAIASNGGDGGLTADQVLYNGFIDRLCEWMESFQSLYALYRMHFCHSIYLHFESFFNIVFCFDSGGDGQATPRVIVSNTHSSFRAHLKKNHIEFATPLDAESSGGGDGGPAAENKENAVDPEELEELQRNGINVRVENKHRKSKGLGAGYNNKSRTTTLIEGKRNVHSFYDFFINYVHRLCLSNKKCHDVPLIFSDKIFLNSKCSLLSMTKNHSGWTADKRMMHTMQLNGYILPAVHHRTVELMAETKQNVAVTSQLNDKMCDGINYCANSKLFRRLKDEHRCDFKSVRKIEVNAKEQRFVVHLQ